MVLLLRRQNQREPQIVPDRDHGEHRDRRHGRPDQRQYQAEEDRVLGEPVDAAGILQVVGNLLHEFRQDEDRQRQALRRVDEDQRGQRVDKVGGHHQLQDRHRAETDRDHDAERQIEPHQRVAAEAVFGQGKAGHRAEQQHEEQRHHGDDETVLEIADEIALTEHGRVADQVEGRRRRQGQRRAEDGGARLERIHHHQDDREQRDDRVGDQDRMCADRAGERGAGLVHGRLRTGSA